MNQKGTKKKWNRCKFIGYFTHGIHLYTLHLIHSSSLCAELRTEMLNVPCEIRDTRLTESDMFSHFTSIIFSRITLEFLQINCIRFCFQVIPFAICIFGLMHHFFLFALLFLLVLVSVHKNNRQTNATESDKKTQLLNVALISYVNLYANDLAQSLRKC